MIKIRTATREDIGQMMPLFDDLYRGCIDPGFSDVLEEFVVADTHMVVVAIADGSLVGVLVGSYRLDIDYECRAGFIDAIVVHSDWRGRGIGPILLKQFAEWAKERGATVLQALNCRRRSFEAIGFTERPATLHQIAVDEIVRLQDDQSCVWRE